MGTIFAILSGWIVGVILNVLADDLPARHAPAKPRCRECGHEHSVLMWSGLARRIGQSGRCPSCDRGETIRPVLVEIGTALVFAFLWNRYQMVSAGLISTAFYFSVFILILITDLEHRLILHAVTFPAFLLALLASFWTITPLAALIGAATGLSFFLLVYWLGGIVFGAGAMGFGDVTLATLIGAATGFPMVIVALLIGVLTGGIVSLGLIATGIRRLRSKVPYGPFLLVGGAITLIWGPQILEWYLR